MHGMTSKGGIRALAIFVGAAVSVASCASGSDRLALATTSKAPTQTAATTATVLPTPDISTHTPEPTPTPDIGMFKVCAPEQFRDCRINPESLFDGSYLAFLDTLSKPFDPVKN